MENGDRFGHCGQSDSHVPLNLTPKKQKINETDCTIYFWTFVSSNVTLQQNGQVKRNSVSSKNVHAIRPDTAPTRKWFVRLAGNESINFHLSHVHILSCQHSHIIQIIK